MNKNKERQIKWDSCRNSISCSGWQGREYFKNDCMECSSWLPHSDFIQKCKICYHNKGLCDLMPTFTFHHNPPLENVCEYRDIPKHKCLICGENLIHRFVKSFEEQKYSPFGFWGCSCGETPTLPLNIKDDTWCQNYINSRFKVVTENELKEIADKEGLEIVYIHA